MTDREHDERMAAGKAAMDELFDKAPLVAMLVLWRHMAPEDRAALLREIEGA